MADKTTTELERVYTIPLRKTKDLVRSRRAQLAVRDVKRFLTRHMKSEDIWLDNEVNELIWARGKFTIPSRVRVRATRFSDGVVEVTLPETSHEGSVRSELAERREKAAERQILKAPAPEEGEAGGHGHPVTDVKGIGPATAEKLEKAGIATAAELAEADPANVAKAIGSEEKAKQFIAAAKEFVANHSHDEPEGEPAAPAQGKAEPPAEAEGTTPEAAKDERKE
ncbi:MAG TPA: 50S ribosomal protein L31e [Candidatus Thermoplasmatota archaeon]|nr:50S ribosomal protein L31e [Candidatus Thermoplasmatota archaeon]